MQRGNDSLDSILQQFSFDEKHCSVEKLHGGLINRTWKITDDSGQFILQKINKTVFKEPEKIAGNIRQLANFLNDQYPSYLFIAPIKSSVGTDMVQDEQGEYFRLFPFVSNSHTIEVVKTTSQAFEAARQFGAFSAALNDFSVSNLHYTIEGFHDLRLRHCQFQEAISNGNSQRIAEAQDLVQTLAQHESIVDSYIHILQNPAFRLRVTHNDTKISNVLFDPADKGIAVIDLDTVMPGYFVSDVGDMMRTYLSPVSEEEKDFCKIEARDDFFEAIVQGYLSEMAPLLTNEELEHFVYAGLFMTYMQAMRFLGDHFNNDVYYGASYDGHNLIRAQNQLTLLQRILEKEPLFHRIVKKAVPTGYHFQT